MNEQLVIGDFRAIDFVFNYLTLTNSQKHEKFIKPVDAALTILDFHIPELELKIENLELSEVLNLKSKIEKRFDAVNVFGGQSLEIEKEIVHHNRVIKHKPNSVFLEKDEIKTEKYPLSKSDYKETIPEGKRNQEILFEGESEVWYNELGWGYGNYLERLVSYLTPIIEDRINELSGNREPENYESESGRYKYLMLHELGVIEFLRGKHRSLQLSENSLAKILHKLTDVKISTIQPIINASNKKEGTKNDAFKLNRHGENKPLEQVRNYLSNEGIECK